MLRRTLVTIGFFGLASMGALGCDKKHDRDDAPTPAQREAAAAATADQRRAEVEKARADQALAAAKDRQERAEDHLDKAKDWAKEVKDDVKVDDHDKNDRDRTVRDDTSWRSDWSRFSASRDRTAERGDYTLERADDGTIVAYRRNRPVAGSDVDDRSIARAVQDKLAGDDDVRAYKIGVSVNDRVVHLRGAVKDADAAGDAVKTALSAAGVEKVVSHLTFDSTK